MPDVFGAFAPLAIAPLSWGSVQGFLSSKNKVCFKVVAVRNEKLVSRKGDEFMLF